MWWLSLIDPISSITKEIIDLKVKQTNAITEQQKIESSERIAQLQSQRDVLVAEARGPWNMLMRALLAFPIALYFAVVMFQKITGWGSTPDLSPDQWRLAYIIYGFYFLNNLARIIKR